MRSVLKSIGTSLIMFLAILIFIIWCFLLGKCSGRGFGMIPPRPLTEPTTGRSKSDDDDKLDTSLAITHPEKSSSVSIAILAHSLIASSENSFVVSVKNP